MLIEEHVAIRRRKNQLMSVFTNLQKFDADGERNLGFSKVEFS